jgi:hypothetical protein
VTFLTLRITDDIFYLFGSRYGRKRLFSRTGASVDRWILLLAEMQQPRTCVAMPAPQYIARALWNRLLLGDRWESECFLLSASEC